MREASQDQYGGPEVVLLRDVNTPEPGEGEVLVEVQAASLTLADTAFRQAKPFITRFFSGLFRPRRLILGSEFSGVVVATGPGAGRFSVGDAVFGCCGSGFGAHREYLAFKQDGVLAPKPAELSHAGAAGLAYSFLTAMPFLRDEARLRAGQRILINGASSSVGAIAIQLARHMGAHVTAVTSGRNAAFAEAQGADVVIDYQTQDFTEAVAEYDVIFDAVGKSSFRRCHGALKPNGIYLTTVPSFGIVGAMLFHRRTDRPRGRLATTGLRPAAARTADLALIAPLVHDGVLRPVTDRVYRLDEIVAAHVYVDTERKRGDVIIAPGAEPV